MTARPRLLDCFVCQGGSSVGYARAGFEVVGVDIAFQKRYPFELHVGDAVQFLADHGHEYQVVSASPPCQRWSTGTRAIDRSRYPALIEPTRELLLQLDVPWVIENVKGAALRDPLMLCGTEFALSAVDDDSTPLEMWRHRLFESNVPLVGNGGCQHGRWAAQCAGSYGGARRDKLEARHVRHGGYVPSKAVQERLLGIEWMDQRGLFQSIPPCYATHVGRQLLAALHG